MIILFPFFLIIFAIIPAMLNAAEIMSPSVYFIIIAGLVLLISAILIISAFSITAAGAGTIKGIMVIIGIAGIAVSTIVGGVSFCCHKFLPAKTATQSEQIKVPVKTKAITENKLKQKHS